MRRLWSRVRSAYDASETGRFRKSKSDRGSANRQLDAAWLPVVTRARDLDNNYDIGAGILDVLTDNVVGSGIAPEFQVMLKDGKPAKAVNDRLTKLWDDWIHVCDVTGEYDYYSMQRQLFRSAARDGESFCQMVVGTVPGLVYESEVPFALEALECDFVPIGKNDDARNIRQGIRHNAWGRPLAYHVFKKHPGDATSFDTTTKEVPAQRMLHFKFTKRFHQSRGMSIFATVLNRLDDIKEIDENERVAARMSAAMAMYIKKGDSAQYEAPAADGSLGPNGEPTLRELEVVPGMIIDNLRPGEDVGSITSNRPNNALIPFRDSNLRGVAAGTKTTFSSISKNYDGTYSAQRQELVEGRRGYETLANAFVYRHCQPVTTMFVMSALAKGLLDLRDVDMGTIYDASFAIPPMVWIDPLKEANANAVCEDRGWTSNSRIIRSRGDKPHQVRNEIVRDQQDIKDKGIKLPENPAQAAEQQEADRQAAAQEPAFEPAARQRNLRVAQPRF